MTAHLAPMVLLLAVVVQGFLSEIVVVSGGEGRGGCACDTVLMVVQPAIGIAPLLVMEVMGAGY